MKIVIYARVSTKKQDLDNMLRSLNEWKEKNNHELFKIYSDFAVSGRKDDRKGINQLLEDARKGLFELVGFGFGLLNLFVLKFSNIRLNAIFK